jgi:hypothetical protein
MDTPKKIKMSSLLESEYLADIYLKNFDLKNQMHKDDIFTYKDEKNHNITLNKSKGDYLLKILKGLLHESNNQHEFYNDFDAIYKETTTYSSPKVQPPKAISYSPQKLPPQMGHYFYDNSSAGYPVIPASKMVFNAKVSTNNIKSTVSSLEEKIPDISENYWDDENSLVIMENNFLYIKTYP